MGLTRVETIALGGATLVAVLVPLLALAPVAVTPADDRSALVSPPADAPALTRVYARALLGGSGVVEDGGPPVDAPELAGIVGRIGSDVVAMVRGADGTTRTLDVGEGVDGWTLESLAIDAAYFTRGGQRVRVALPAGE